MGSSIFICFFDISQSGQYTGTHNEYGAGDDPDAQRFGENQKADDNAGDGLQCAENRGPLSADQEDALLEQHDGTGGYEQGEENTQSPAGGSCGE